MKELRASLESGLLTNNGPHLRSLEARAAAYLGTDEAVAVSCGADALLLAVAALEPSGAAVLPAFTYIASLSAVAHAGLRPVFCDIDPETWTMDPARLEEILRRERGVSVVMPVNVFGVPPELEEIAGLARRAGAEMIYDNAQGFGTETEGLRLPREPLAQVFSLHATKLLPAVEGGLIVSRRPELLGRIRRLRNHGLAEDLFDSTPGYNAKMDELHALVGLHSLRGFSEALKRRRSYGERLTGFLRREAPGFFTTQRVPAGVLPNFQNLGALCAVPDEDALASVIEELARRGVGARRFFYPPLHRLKIHRDGPSLPVTERVCRSQLCLPIHSRMTEKDLRAIEEAAAHVARKFA